MKPTWSARPGKALAIRTCGSGQEWGHAKPGVLFAHGGFEWPERIGAVVEPERWDASPQCGHGLHGLLWGRGNLNYLGTGSREDGTVYMVVEVDEDDCVWVGGDKVKFPRCTIIHIGTWAECATLINENAPFKAELRQQFADLSAYPHKTYAVNLERIGTNERLPDGEYLEDMDERIDVPLGPLSTVYSSEVDSAAPQPDPFDVFGPPPVDSIGEDMHTVALDIDVPVRVLPSSSYGHYHLLIDVAMPWWKYRRLLKALAKAGIIERGYYRASVRRRATFLRLPWVKKK
jgi:hypothetical protein